MKDLKNWAIVILGIICLGLYWSYQHKADQLNMVQMAEFQRAIEEDIARYSDDEIILYTLLEVWAEDLDKTYNPANLEECPWEEGNWVLDVACEMDWRDLVPLITAMPSFGSDSDYELLNEIIN